MNRPRWWKDAKCLGIGCQLFFPPSHPDVETPRERSRREARAKAMCRECPVRSDCLQDALVSGDDGVRGGTTPGDRRRMTAPLPQRRQYVEDSDWQVVVNRPGLLNPGMIRLEQNLQ
jgi:WhiB family redox-sensing transcriptional regulator